MKDKGTGQRRERRRMTKFDIAFERFGQDPIWRIKTLIGAGAAMAGSLFDVDIGLAPVSIGAGIRGNCQSPRTNDQANTEGEV